jgi:hypothetical protein
MGLDLMKFQAICVEVTDVYVEEIGQKAHLAAIAAHAPEKLKDVLPKPSKPKPPGQDGRKSMQDFINHVGSF